MANPALQCPDCKVELKYLTTLSSSDNFKVTDVADVGRCPTCSRQWFRSQITGSYKAMPWQPLCPRCNDRIEFLSGDGDKGLIYACRRHPGERFHLADVQGGWVHL